MYKVLYVDDEPELLEFSQIFLNTHWGFSVETAISVKDALLKLKTEKYDAIISDYEMPDMDGISFLKFLRSKDFSEPFILFSARNREEIAIEALNNGADYYLQKGVDTVTLYTELANMIKMAIEKRRAEEELESANLLSSTIINHFPDPTFIVNTKGKIISWNHALEKITGTNAQNMFSKDVNEAFFQLYGVRHFPLVNVILNPDIDLTSTHDKIEYEEGPITAETKITDSFGRERTLWVKVSPLYDKNMQISAAVETIRDITRIKKTEKDLRETSQQLQNIIDFIPDPTFVIDNHGKVIAWNHAIENLTGARTSSIIGEGNYAYSLPFYTERRPILIDLLFKDDQKVKELYRNVKSVDNHLTAEIYIKKINERDGIYLWGIATPLYDTQGNRTGAIESIRDISLIKELELELKQGYEDLNRSYEEIAAQNEEIKASIGEMADREILLVNSERKYRSLIEHLPYGIIINGKGKIQYVNPMAATILGYDNSGELIDTQALNLVHPDRREKISQKIINYNNSPHNFIEEKFLKKDGTEVPVEVTGLHITFDDSKSVMILFRDISRECNRKNALNQARKKLDILTSITQHDLRNQVSILVTTLDLLSDENLTESASSLLNNAIITGQNIRDNLKINDDYKTLGLQEPQWFFVKNLVQQAGRSCQVSDKLSFSGGDFEIYASPLMGRVFDNLIDNSLRHGGDVNQIFINVVTHSGDLLIIYEDDGAGVPDDEKERIFIKGHGKNTGLGLYLISEILSVTDITIRECGKSGEGAMFEMRVPHGKWRYCDY